jgi:hypothetical protein
MDPDPKFLNPDPIRIRIHNPDLKGHHHKKSVLSRPKGDALDLNHGLPPEVGIIPAGSNG